MKKKIEFCLLYRDMWQSSGKYVPRVDQLKEIAPAILKMDVFRELNRMAGLLSR